MAWERDTRRMGAAGDHASWAAHDHVPLKIAWVEAEAFQNIRDEGIPV